MFVIRHNKFDWNAHVIMQIYFRYLVNKFTHNTSLVVIIFLFRELRLSTLTNWDHPPYLWQNSILIFLMKVIRMLALLWHIFVFFFDFFLQNKNSSIIDNHVGPHAWLSNAVSFFISYLSTSMSCFRIFHYFLQSIKSTQTWKICGWWFEW